MGSHFSRKMPVLILKILKLKENFANMPQQIMRLTEGKGGDTSEEIIFEI